MLFEEFQKLTENKSTFEEYEYINKIYMDMAGTPDEIEKEDCVILWNTTFGKKWEKKKKQDEELKKYIIHEICEGPFYFCQFPEDIQNYINGIKGKIKKEIEFTGWFNKIFEYKDSIGITWILKRSSVKDRVSQLYVKIKKELVFSKTELYIHSF